MKKIVVLISANAEWCEVINFYQPQKIKNSPFGEFFEMEMEDRQVVFFQGGWGKISAAASTQYAIDHFSAQTLINLGTCGGFAGKINAGEIVLAAKTLVYDIVEQMGDAEEAIRFYTVNTKPAWLTGSYPQDVLETILVSADRDLIVEQIPDLISKYAAVAGDWESGAIAWVAERNHAHCLILRGVSDLVGESGGEAYGKMHVFESRTGWVMQKLFKALPNWIKVMP